MVLGDLTKELNASRLGIQLSGAVGANSTPAGSPYFTVAACSFSRLCCASQRSRREQDEDADDPRIVNGLRVGYCPPAGQLSRLKSVAAVNPNRKGRKIGRGFPRMKNQEQTSNRFE
jgi:hypothetical protein